MSPPADRSWRFVHPDLGESGRAPGLQVSTTGKIELVEGDASVRQSLLLLLSTIPGERVMRPDYGCDLHLLLFELRDYTTAGLAMHYVREAIRRWEPRVEIVELSAEFDERQPYRLDIVLEYRVRRSLDAGQLTFSLELAGDQR